MDIDDVLLDGLVKITGQSKQSTAVARAVEKFVRRRRASEFGRMLREG